MQYRGTIQISDLSFCELFTEERLDIRGGFIIHLHGYSPQQLLTSEFISLLNSHLEAASDDQQTVYTDEKATITKLQDSQTGLYGYEVKNNDNGTLTIVLIKGNAVASAAVLT